MIPFQPSITGFSKGMGLTKGDILYPYKGKDKKKQAAGKPLA